MQTECYTRLVTHRRTCTQPRLQTSSAGRKKKKSAWWPRCALLNTHILPAAQYKYIYARMDFLGGFCNLKGCLENYLSKWAEVDPPPSSTMRMRRIMITQHRQGAFCGHFYFSSFNLADNTTFTYQTCECRTFTLYNWVFFTLRYCYFYLSAGSEKKKKTSSLTLIKPPTCSVRQSFSSTK